MVSCLPIVVYDWLIEGPMPPNSRDVMKCFSQIRVCDYANDDTKTDVAQSASFA